MAGAAGGGGISRRSRAAAALPGTDLIRPGGKMIREKILKVVLVIVGILFLATVYPLVAMHLEESLQMMLSIYVTLGVFLLLASRDPSANRSLIAFTAWSS